MVSTVLTFAFPLASYAGAPGPTPPHPVTPSDTLSKLEKGKTERPAPAPKKRLKAHQSAPVTRSDFLPDQPWETEFYVENNIPGHRAMQLALASFSPRR